MGLIMNMSSYVERVKRPPLYSALHKLDCIPKLDAPLTNNSKQLSPNTQSTVQKYMLYKHQLLLHQEHADRMIDAQHKLHFIWKDTTNRIFNITYRVAIKHELRQPDFMSNQDDTIYLYVQLHQTD